MSERPSLSIDDLPPAMRKALRQQGVKKPRRVTMSKDQVRTAAFRVLAVVAELSPAERRRVLSHAVKLNEV